MRNRWICKSRAGGRRGKGKGERRAVLRQPAASKNRPRKWPDQQRDFLDREGWSDALQINTNVKKGKERE